MKYQQSFLQVELFLKLWHKVCLSPKDSDMSDAMKISADPNVPYRVHSCSSTGWCWASKPSEWSWVWSCSHWEKGEHSKLLIKEDSIFSMDVEKDNQTLTHLVLLFIHVKKTKIICKDDKLPCHRRVMAALSAKIVPNYFICLFKIKLIKWSGQSHQRPEEL